MDHQSDPRSFIVRKTADDVFKMCLPFPNAQKVGTHSLLSQHRQG